MKKNLRTKFVGMDVHQKLFLSLSPMMVLMGKLGFMERHDRNNVK